MRKKERSVWQRISSFALAVILVLGLLPVRALADDSLGVPVGEVTTVADPDTVSRPADVYGDNTKNAGKVTVGKSVSDGPVTLNYGNTSQTFTPGEDGFIVTVSQTAQIMGMVSESQVPLDVVFILDTSGSMNEGGVNRSASMVTAANTAIKTLLEANEHNRVAVVAFSSNEYGGGTSEDAAANVLSSLAHYSGEAATNHLRWVNSSGNATGNGRSYIAGRDMVEITEEADNWWEEDYTYTTVARRHGYSGGTNIHAGIVAGAKLLTASTNNPTVTTADGVMTRMPFIVILSDGQPTFSIDNTTWYDPNGVTQQGNGSNAYAGNGFLPAVTAAYYKGMITEKYYGSSASEFNRCSIYTIGVQLNEELAEITLNPRGHFSATAGNAYYTSFSSYWNSFNATPAASFDVKVGGRDDYSFSAESIRAARNYVSGKSSTGKTMYNGGLSYNDDYFAATQTADIENAFKNVVNSIQTKALSVPTKVDDAYGDDFSGYVTFTDPIGEYMEVKNVHGLLAQGNWYRGQSMAYHLRNWASAPQSFKDQFARTIQTRGLITGTGIDIDALVTKAVASPNQANWFSENDYDNSIVWWGNDINSATEIDEHVQYLDIADNDTLEYIQSAEAQAAISRLGAEYVCRSYFFYGAGGDYSELPDQELMYFIIRVQRSLKAPYQQTVVVSAPASLLSVEKVLVTEKLNAAGDHEYTVAVTEAEPARVVYEVGLRSDINAFNVADILEKDQAYLNETAVFGGQMVHTNYNSNEKTYAFYTNDWDRNKAEGSHERAMTKATFDAASDNEFYTYTQDALIYVKNGDRYVPYTGTGKPAGSGYYYARTVYDWSGASRNADGSYDAELVTEYIPVFLPDTDVIFSENGSWYIRKGAYKASSLTGGEDIYKSENKTQTSAVVVHPHRTSSENDSHYTVYLGNNGKLTLKAQQSKHVSIEKADGTVITNGDGCTVMVGDVLTYTLDIVNFSENAVTADVTDTVPRGTAYVNGSATHGGVYTAADGKITWDDVPVGAGQTVQVSFKVTVTENALSGDLDVATINNQAFVQLSNGFSYTTNVTENPPEGKKVVDSEGNPIVDGVEVPQVLVYRIRWHNDSGSTATVQVTDIIPAGTTYVDGSASHNAVYDAAAQTMTWTLTDVAAGASGVVSFRVSVNADAVEYIENSAAVKVGNNDPRQTNKTQVEVKTGDLVLTKTVEDNGFTAASNRSFTLNITEIGLDLDGVYTMLRNGVEETVTFTGGVAAVTIRDGDRLEILALPAGTVISVTEAYQEGFTPAYTTASAVSVNEGRVKITAGGDMQVDVTNVYTPKAVSFQMEGKKVLSTSADVGELTFGFTAYACDANGENPVEGSLLTGEATVSGASKEVSFKFAPVTFDREGTYYYLISELNGYVNGVTYSEEKYLVTVAVTDDGSGQLKAEATLRKWDAAASAFTDASTLRFTNTYAPKQTELTLEADKVLTGRTLKDGEFSFVVLDGSGNVVSTGSNDAEGNVAFRPITYKAEGTYSYTIREMVGGLRGVEYSTAQFAITVTVEDVDGRLVATAAYPAGGVVFTNVFTPDGITVTLEADKELDNRTGDSRPLKDGEFSFVVKDGDKVVATGRNAADGKIVFTPIGYTLADVGKTYTYTVSEIIPDLSADPYMDYDETSFQVFVTVSQAADGNLVAAVAYPDGGVVFTNIQYPSSVEITPSANKTTQAENNNLPENTSFSFTVINADTGNEAGVGVSMANGRFQFSTMSFSEAGTYRYWIKETHAGMEQHGIKYDASVFLMVVEVTNTEGKLEAAYTYYALKENGDPSSIADYTVELTDVPSFHNYYNAVGQIALQATKKLTGLTLKAGDFAFKLVRQDTGNEVTGLVDADGTIRFAAMYFDLGDFESAEQKERILHYKMSEIIPEHAKLPGVTYDPSVFDVYVKITHNDEGTITAQLTDAQGNPVVDDQGNGTTMTDAVFTNRYVPVEGVSADMEASKVLTGREMTAGEFVFKLYHVDVAGVEHLVDTATADANGKIRFTRVYAPTIMAGNDSIVITYVIREVNNQLSGVTYDPAEFTVKVTLTDNKDGTLSSSVAYEGLEDGKTPVFRNTYDAEGTTYAPEASKVLENRDIRKGEFSFVITDAQGNVVSTGTNSADADGDGLFDDVVFTPIGYEEAGVYAYTVSEVKGNLPGVQYTNVTYKLVVTVVDETDAGKLVATGVFYAAEDAQNANPVEAVFTNVFTPEDVVVQLQADKLLTGRDMEAGEFSFVAETLDGKVMATGGNTAGEDGQKSPIVFSHIGYKLADLNGAEFVDLIYRVREVSTTLGGVKSDDAVFYAWIRVSYDDQTGKLSAQVMGYSNSYEQGSFNSNVEAITFENTYAPSPAQLAIPTDKTLINKVLEADEFTFVLKDANGNVLQEKGNAADGTVAFDALTFDKPGTYVYTVSEKVTDAGKADSYTLDNDFVVVVTVADDLKGNLIVTATYHEMDASGNYDEELNLGGVEFINRYTAPPVTKDLSLAIGATKTVEAPEGMDYSPAGFEFDVVDIKNNVIATGVSDADGNITFSDFTFTQAGEYHYWVYEKATDKGGITIDSRAWEIHILVRYNEQTGLLYIADTDVQTYLYGPRTEDNNDPAFVNVYAPAPTTLYLTATKLLAGRDLREHEFLFYLMEGDTIAAEAFNQANGQVKFELTYTQTGTHTYKIVEVEGDRGGVTYDTKVYNAVTVEVRDDGNGQLVAYIAGERVSNGASVGTGITVNNTYTAKPAQALVVAHKQMLGDRPLKGSDFTFELKNTEDPGEVYTAKNDLNGHVEFILSLEEKGVFTYTLREIKGNDPSITYDETVYTVTITVTDDGSGQLYARVAFEGLEGEHGPVFKNVYKAQPVTAQIQAHKTLLGEKPLTEGLYTFELEGEGVKISDVTNDASGNVVFHVTFEEVGEYSYILRETQGTDAGTTYDPTEYRVKVVVTDNLAGNLVAEVIYEDLEAGKTPGFTNSYRGEAVPVKITATKTLEGRTLSAEEFSFQLVNRLDPTQVITARNDANGNVAFDLVFENSGVFVYTLSEVVGSDANITYDPAAYTVTVTVTDDLQGYLTAKVEYSTTSGAAPAFRNAYTPNALVLTLEGTKQLTGKDLEENEFSFQVRDSRGNLVATAKNNAAGNIVFSDIKLATAGEYTFRVNEVKGNNVNMTYDETVFTVTVRVTNDNGVLKAQTVYPEGGIVFKNIYEKVDPNNPDTGDRSGMMFYAVTLAMSLLGLAVVLVAMHQPRRKTYRR